MRIHAGAAAYEGEFVDWKGIAFDGSHGTHTSIKGDAMMITPNQSSLANPSSEIGKTKESLVGMAEDSGLCPVPGFNTWVSFKMVTRQNSLSGR